MGTLISKVEDRFQIAGRGCIVVPGIPSVAAFNDLKLKVGDAIVLKRPDGTEVQTTIQAFDMGGMNIGVTPLVLGAEMTSAMVPVGTELWTT